VKREIRYGKAEIRCYRAYAGEPALFGTETTVDVFGDSFMESYTEGDNRNVVATDTMKNFTYAALLEYEGSTHEGWAEFLARRFLDTYPQMEWVRIREHELPFLAHSDKLFEGPRRDEYGVVELQIGREGIRSLRAGVRQLRLVKLTGSAVADFMRDEYTTLPERTDRPLYIFCDVHWKYSDPTRPVDPHAVADACREVFDGFVSMSIQHLLNEFGTVLLDRYQQVSEFSFEAQNRLWDTSAVSDQDPRRRVFSDPKPAHGLIGLTVTR
jgi:urate oxidase / 2-oxo-4-hydroxy-4-carboxy-5-ureidoimidazoline decarboxylase